MPGMGESDHDLLIELRRDVKHVLKVLEGNGQEGLCSQVEKMGVAITKHDVYFAIMGAVLVIVGAGVAGWVLA